MANEEVERAAKERSHAPEVVAPSTKVNVALPFSSIQIQEPSRGLAELATLVEALARLVRQMSPGHESEALVKRARAVAARLQ
jgi:hypothetical protein